MLIVSFNTMSLSIVLRAGKVILSPIITLLPIVEKSPIDTLSPIKVFSPIVTFLPNSTSLPIEQLLQIIERIPTLILLLVVTESSICILFARISALFLISNICFLFIIYFL